MERNEKTPLWTKNFLLVTLCNLLLCFVFQMLIPTLPMFVARLGASGVEIGLIVGIFTISAVLTRPFAGKAIDTMDRKKLLFIALLLFLACVCGYYWLASIFLVLALRFVHGIAWGITTTTYGVMASDTIPPARLGEGMGYFTLSNNIALAIGPVVGLALMNRYGFGVLFAVATGITLLLLAVSQFVPESKTVASQKPGETPSIWTRILERNSLFPSFLVFFVGINYGGILSFLTLFGQEAGLENVSLFFLINAVFIVLIRPLSGKLFDRKGPSWVLLPGAFFWATGLLLLSYATSSATLMTAALFFGIGYGAIQPALQAWAVHRAGPSRRGMATGTFLSFYDLGIGLGSVVLGMIAQSTSYAMMYRWSALVPIGYLLVFAWYMWRGRGQKTVQRHIAGKAEPFQIEAGMD